jgi:predicted alpha/beta-fold hydrolase
MIALRNDCLLFELNNGESVPCSADMIAVEIVGEANSLLEPETLRHAAASVFHYFKTELAREAVTVGEFSLALEKVLHHLGYSIHAHDPGGRPDESSETDLARVLGESGDCLELLFFPRLRDELRDRLRHSPRVVRFHGLRGCVKQLAGARRWSRRCEQLQDQIVGYLRGCLTAETAQNDCALVVE